MSLTEKIIEELNNYAMAYDRDQFGLPVLKYGEEMKALVEEIINQHTTTLVCPICRGLSHMNNATESHIRKCYQCLGQKTLKVLIN